MLSPSLKSRPIRQSCGLSDLLIWVYRDQKADMMSGLSLWVPQGLEGERDGAKSTHYAGWSGCGCAQLESIAQLGARLNPPGWQRPALHPDAEVIHEALVAMSHDDWMGALLLLRHARAGDVPEWGNGRQELVPVYDSRDRVIQDAYDEVVAVRNDKGRKYMVPLRYCPLTRHPSDDWVEMTRGEYRLWVGALGSLAARLAGKPLSRWRLDGLGVAREPWGNKT